MDIKKVQELLKVVEENDIAEIEVEQDGLRIMIRKTAYQTVAPMAAQMAVPAYSAATVPTEAGAAPATVEPANPEEAGTVVKSPIVGTFYTAPSPDDANFVKVGDVISEGQVLCIIEAMKIMNEIESEVSGKVVKILVESGNPVEYDQPLFVVA